MTESGEFDELDSAEEGHETEWQILLPLEEQDGELVFRTDIADKPVGPWWKVLPTTLSAGAVIGILMWYLWDREFTLLRVILWPGIAAALTGILMLPCFRRGELREFRFSAAGFRIITNGGDRSVAWKDLEAARFEAYPIMNTKSNMPCFQFRTGGQNREIGISGLAEDKFKLFCRVMEKYLERHGIPDRTRELRSFQYGLSLVSAWVFGIGLIGMIMAHLLVLHTLGTIFGLAVILTGTVMALMTWRERISKWVITLTVLLFAAVVIYVQAFGVNVRQTLLDWEQRERRLGRPPWGQQDRLQETPADPSESNG